MKTETILKNMEVINGIDTNAAAQAAAHVLSRRDTLKLAPAIFEGGRQLINGLKDLFSPQDEQLKNFSGYIIGESTVGPITSLTTADTQHSNLDSAVRRSAAKVVTLSNTRGIPRLDSKNRLKTTIFNMNGITGNAAPLVVLHETDTKDHSVGRAYLAFGLKKETVNGQNIDYLTVPSVDNVGILVALKQYEYPNGEIVLGVPDLEKPEEINTPIFVIKTEKVTDKKGNVITKFVKTSFLPPFAASSIGPVDAPKNTFTRVTVERARKQTETPVETQLPPEMTERYINQFASVETGKKTINSKETDVFYGVEKDGTKKVIAMEIETDGELKMTRVGEYTDDAGFSYYVMMGNIGQIDGSMEGRFNVTDQTAEKLFKIDESKGAVNIWNSLAKQWSTQTEEMTSEQARKKVMIDNNGSSLFDVTVGKVSTTEDYPSSHKPLQQAANFNLPIKIVTLATTDDYNKLPSEIKNRLVIDLSLYKDTGGLFDTAADSLDPNNESFITGGSVFVEPNGQLVILSIATDVSYNNGLNPEKLSQYQKGLLNKYLQERLGQYILLNIDLIGSPDLSQKIKTSNGYKSQINSLFEINPFITNETSQ